MPIVFATDAPTASGHQYADILGKQYEFPLIYSKLVETGDAFVYYRGRRGAPTGRPDYFGCGIVGEVCPSSTPGNFIAELDDVQIFEPPIPAKAPNGIYLETGTARRTNFANGVRRISDTVLAAILAANPLTPAAPTDGSTRRKPSGPAHASPEHARRLERYSVDVVLDLLGHEFGADQVEEMPPGNPGYDILVHRRSQNLHVEVKGTVLPEPVFHLSEGQRKHAEALGDGFRLIVLYDVDPLRHTHRLLSLNGPLDESKVALTTSSWVGRVLDT